MITSAVPPSPGVVGAVPPSPGVVGAILPLQAIAIDDAIGGLVISGMLVVIGALVMRDAFRRRKQRQLIEETPTEEIESLTLGPSEVKGTVVAGEEPLRAPFSEDDCVIARWKVEQYHYDHEDNRGEWREVRSGVECVPFYVDDGTGRLRVEPDEDVVYEIEKDTEPMFEVDARQRPPEAVGTFFRDRGFSPVESLRSTLDLPGGFTFNRGGGFSFGLGDRHSGDRRYYQHLIRPDEDVYVFGTVQLRDGVRSADNAENLLIKRVPKEDRDLEPMFMIADHPEARLRKSRRFALLRFPVGALLFTGGVGGLLYVGSLLLGIDLAVF